MTITEHLRQTQQLIEDTAIKYGRKPQDIRLIGVTKGQPLLAIQEAYNAGLTEFAENYWQEAQEKMKPLSHLPITWHFIGPIQSNKTPDIANHFSWIHSVSREKIVSLLASHRNPVLPPLNICIQVNLDEEPNKSGAKPSEINALIEQILRLPTLKLRGLMAIPKPRYNEDEQYAGFCRLTELFKELNLSLDEKLDTLSMGMSDDFVAAIRAGSTMVRIGQTIFGQRHQN